MEDAWRSLSSALRRFMDKYDLTQMWVAETLGISQPQVSYLLGNTKRERTRELLGGEACAIELRARAEKDPNIVLGEIFRDAGLVEDGLHPADVVAQYPNLDPGVRDDIAVLITRAEDRYLHRAGLDPEDDSPPPPARLRRAQPTPPSGGSSRRGSTPTDEAPPRLRRR